MKILYCTDFSEAALYSLFRAIPFLKPDCKVDIISVIESAYENIEIYRQNKVQNLEKTRQILADKGLKVAKTLHPLGDPAEEVIKQVHSSRYDLIVTGARRDFWLKWLGSTSRKIVTKSHIPVYIAKNVAIPPSSNKKDVLFAVDESQNSYNSVAKTIETLNFKNSTIELIYVKQGKEGLPVEILSDKEWLERLLAMEEERAKEIINKFSVFIHEKGLKVSSSLILEGEAATEIMKHAEKTEKDLIVMGSHGRAGVSSLILGSVSKRVIDSTTIPVIIIPPSKT